MTETDLRITNSSWLDFYEQYIMPSILDTIQYNQVVKSVNYSQDIIEIRTGTEVFTANRVIVTVPVAILQVVDIQFIPALPDGKQKAIKKLEIHDGCKGFIAFKERFYPTVIDMRAGDDGQGSIMMVLTDTTPKTIFWVLRQSVRCFSRTKSLKIQVVSIL